MICALSNIQMHRLKKRLGKIKRSIKQSSKLSFFYLRRKCRKSMRTLLFVRAATINNYTFVIICVKKTEYVDMAIDNANSLHFINSGHRFMIYADTVCNEAFRKLRHKLDYPSQMICTDIFGTALRPWQYYKLEALIDASRKGYILTDADEIWHHDPVINMEHVVMLVLSNPIKQNPVENSVALRLFADHNAVESKHYCTGFVYIPPRYMTEALANDMRKCVDILRTDPLDFLEDDKRIAIRRLADELGMNIALQHDYKGVIDTLKQSDGPKDRNILQSIYYGCKNGIN